MSTAETTWISGPVWCASGSAPFVCASRSPSAEQALLGEVIRIAREEITVQLYEDTSGCVRGSRSPDPVGSCRSESGRRSCRGSSTGCCARSATPAIPTSNPACSRKPRVAFASRRACVSAMPSWRARPSARSPTAPGSTNAVWSRPTCRAGASPRSPTPPSIRTTSRSAGSRRTTAGASPSPCPTTGRYGSRVPSPRGCPRTIPC